jgi:type II secretory pathway pseudopilin PulG
VRRLLILIVVPLALLGVIAAPNLFTATQRSRQKQTMADMRTLATAIEEYWTDHPDWRPANSAGSAARLATLLKPKYMKEIPVRDGWGRPFGVFFGGTEYTIWSLGKDGKRDPKWQGAFTSFDNDLVYQNGTFTQYPEGT